MGCNSLNAVHITDLAKWCDIIFETDNSNPLQFAHRLFFNGEEIKDLVIPDNVTSIGNHAFQNCSGLTSLTLSNTVKVIGKFAFMNCTELTSIDIPDNVNLISDCAFCNCSSLNSVTIPNSITKISIHTFDECRSLTSIVIPNSVTEIGGSAFEDCTALISVTIPNSVTRLGGSAFANCKSLISVDIPNSVTSIETSTFANCSSLNSVIIPNSVTSIGHSAFQGCKCLPFISIPDCVTSIGISAFQDCSSLTSIIIPSGITSIEDEVFSGCSGLTSVTIPEGIKTIGRTAFRGCTSMLAITIPQSVTSIGEGAFYECSSIKTFTLPKNVNSIGNYAFGNCYSLKLVKSLLETPSDVSVNTFIGISSSAILQVPRGMKRLYESYSGWANHFSEIIEIDASDEEFEVITYDGINYSLISNENKTMRVASGNYGVVLEVPDVVNYQNEKWTVNGINRGALSGNTELAAIVWHPDTVFTENVDNPNLLLYVKSASHAPTSIKNVVVNGSANSIVLSEASSKNDFYCPLEFTAKTISYTHNYNMETGLGIARGWETIALPFDVQKVTHSSKGNIKSFAKWHSGDAEKPFWLMELTGSGWTAAESIKANTPYIISMPNNQEYKAGFQLNGCVTFSAENVKVHKTDNLHPAVFESKTFVPNFALKESDVYVLNVVNDLEQNRGDATEGSTFIWNLRPVHPFEAYMTTTQATRSIPIDDAMPTGIDCLVLTNDGPEEWYDLQGRRVKQPAKGVYIRNSKKLIIR